jgi:hypothetical protein
MEKRTKKHLIVSYQKAWGKDGTFYDQHIKINKDFIKYINKQIKHYHNADYENKNIIADTIGFSTYYDCYLNELDIRNKYNYLTLTQLSFIYYYLSVNNYDINRIKRRNTIIEVV